MKWDRECEAWGQKCGQLCSDLIRGTLFLDSSDSPTQLPVRGGGGTPDGIELARLPLLGPQGMVFVVLPGAFHKPRGKVLQARRRRAANLPEMTVEKRFRAHPAVPKTRSAVPLEHSYLRGSEAAPTAAAAGA